MKLDRITIIFAGIIISLFMGLFMGILIYGLLGLISGYSMVFTLKEVAIIWGLFVGIDVFSDYKKEFLE